MPDAPAATLRYYGISPWEIEVLYGFLNARFSITQEETGQTHESYVSSLDLLIPLQFNEEFFQWFEFRRWERVKAVFKEMKRRRGSGNALRVGITFAGRPTVTFTIDSAEKQWFDNAVEKVDFVLELLPYHLDPQKLPAGASEVSYRFDSASARWRLDGASAGRARYAFRGGSWQGLT